MSSEIKIIPIEFFCPEAGCKISGEFIRGIIGTVSLRCEQYPNSCRVTIRRIKDPDIVGALAFRVAGWCAQKDDWLSQQIVVDAVTGQTLHSK